MSAPQSMNWRRSELLCDADDSIQRTLTSRGISPESAEQASAAVIEMLMQHWAGQQINFPSFRASLRERDASILEQSATRSIADLAREYGLSERAIRKVLVRAKRRAS